MVGELWRTAVVVFGDGLARQGDDMVAAFNSLSIRRLGVPTEIAETVLYLASDGSGYMTGQNLCVDGGWTMMG